MKSMSIPFSRTNDDILNEPVSTASLFKSALTAHQAGQLIEAAEGYRQIISIDRLHADALYLLGIVHQQMGNFSDAEILIRESLASRKDALIFVTLGFLLQDAKRFSEAEVVYRCALELKPDYADAYNNLGLLLKATIRLAEAEAAYRCALELKPDYAEVHYNLGNLFQETGRVLEAEAAYHRAIELKPDFADARWNLSWLLLTLGRYAGVARLRVPL